MRISQFRPMLAFALLVVSALTAAAQTAPAQPDPERVLAAVDERYRKLKSLRTTFTESYRGAGLTRNESGTLLLKKPGKMRWDYTAPRKKVFVSDGKSAIFYVPGERQARKASMKTLDDLRSPLRFLLGKSRLRKEFEGLTYSREAQPSAPGNVVLRGVPKHLADRVSQVLLEINSSSQIVRLVIEELDGSTTEFRFGNIEENPALADSDFRLALPAHVEMIESTEALQ